MYISSVEISLNSRPKIIAEIGINHGGDLDVAKHMAESAAESGADFIKTQFHIPSSEMSNAAKEVIPSHCSQSIYSIIEDCSLTLDEEYELKTFIDSLGVVYLSTPFSIKAAEILGSQFNVQAFKVGSGEFNNKQMLDTLLSFKRPLILSTGMNTIDSVERSFNYISKSSSDFILMHTTNLYPTPIDCVRLGSLDELIDIVGPGRIGLSDHTCDNLACLGAVAKGAVVLERHFTDSKDRVGPDIINSMTPSELVSLRRDSEIMHIMCNGQKDDTSSIETDSRNFAFATFVSTRDMEVGHVINPDDVIAMRPCLGDFHPFDDHLLYGSIAGVFIPSGTHIKKCHLK